MARTEATVAEYLLTRLKQIGVDHLFGVPGDFVLGFFNQVLQSDIKYVGTCNELNAAYAADGYARIRGIGAFSSTYAVGELSALNGVAGAFAERVPVVVVTGSPATTYFRTRPLLHHTLGDYSTPLHVYEKVTAAAVHLENPETAPAEIDRVLSICLTAKRPVYISLPSDMVRRRCAAPGSWTAPSQPSSDANALGEAVAEAVAMLEKASKPVIIGDVELIRYNLRQPFADLVEQTGYPYVTMMLGKTVLDESHPQFIGLYQGDRSRDYVRQRVESADCILNLGSLLSDFNTGGFTIQLDDAKTIAANIDTVKIRHHFYANVYLADFIAALRQRLVKRDPAGLDVKRAMDGCVHRRTQDYQPEPGKPLTVSRLFHRLSHFLQPGAVVVAETGVSLFSAAETLMPPGATFIGQTFYGSIGYTVGATLGAAVAAPDRQVVLIVGDGSFQVTCQDLSTMIRYGLKPTVILLNNDGYTIERVIVDHSYNDIQPWRYHQLPQVFGGGPGFDARNEGELEEALGKAAAAKDLVFIEVHTDRLDCSESLRRAGKTMAKNNQLE